MKNNDDLLISLRNEIDIIDDSMRRLFEKRMNTIKEITKIKKELNIPILNVTRENEIIIKNSNFVSKEFKKYYISFLKETMKISREYQEDNYEE